MKTSNFFQKATKILIAGLFIAGPLTITSCDDCKDVVCENGGTCDEGVCDCPDGTKGESCGTFIVTPNSLKGTWTVISMTENGQTNPLNDDAMLFIFDGCASGTNCPGTFRVTESSSSGDYLRVRVSQLTYNVAADNSSVTVTAAKTVTTTTENGQTSTTERDCTSNCVGTYNVSDYNAKEMKFTLGSTTLNLKKK
jgi:hypothetical protein